jgi:hypothetical protein
MEVFYQMQKIIKYGYSMHFLGTGEMQFLTEFALPYSRRERAKVTSLVMCLLKSA